MYSATSASLDPSSGYTGALHKSIVGYVRNFTHPIHVWGLIWTNIKKNLVEANTSQQEHKLRLWSSGVWCGRQVPLFRRNLPWRWYKISHMHPCHQKSAKWPCPRRQTRRTFFFFCGFNGWFVCVQLPRNTNRAMAFSVWSVSRCS
jgi:hypothetical protein